MSHGGSNIILCTHHIGQISETDGVMHTLGKTNHKQKKRNAF